MNVAEVDALAAAAHAGQVDKIGVPYIEHVRAVAAGLVPFGDHLVMAGLLHDVIEDTDWTAEQLREAGVPAHVVSLVEAVTNERGVPYEEKVARITGRGRDAVLLKVADNAHNSHPERTVKLSEEQRTRLATKYRAARDILWPAVEDRDIETIVRIVNPSLLDELRERQNAGSPS
ncbi:MULTISPECIES: HD domain-containing protein [Streptomyces]|uniref:Phosphohydrolase n=2 Tax=Streptomyces TaxID=1883 RepID=A0A1E7LJC3_9ACTN|nr:HD domain-containing protein [Streptomyces nanshensis]OEV16322.1 phosphohydrolase [Streptomyces nanshensis]